MVSQIASSFWCKYNLTITLLRTWVLLLLRLKHEGRNPTNDVVSSWSDGQVGFIHSWYKSPTHQATLRICLSPDGSSSTPWQGWLVRSKVKSRLGCRVQPGNSSTSSNGTSSLLLGSLALPLQEYIFVIKFINLVMLGDAQGNFLKVT